jgi:AraC-like DNA-binding protein
MKEIPLRKLNSPRKEPSFPGNFNIRDISQLLSRNDMVQELHRHDFFYILALKKGKGSHVIDFTPYPVSNNLVFVMRPGQVHEVEVKAGCTGYLIGFQRDLYNEGDVSMSRLLRDVGSDNSYKLEAKEFDKAMTILNAIYEEFTGQRERHVEVIKAYLRIFFTTLIRNREVKRSKPDSSNRYLQERFDEFIELLEKHLAEHKHVAEYAEILNISTYQLNAVTKAITGKTCSAVIDDQVILESKRYLLATSSQINQIAYHLGFEDVSYFIRFFKKHTGYSPEAFRRNNNRN